MSDGIHSNVPVESVRVEGGHHSTRLRIYMHISF